MKMNKSAVVLSLVFTLLLAVVQVQAADKKVKSVEGKALFNNAKLAGSANDKSCNSCHPDGKGLERVWLEGDLAKMINNCIAGALKGDALPKTSPEMIALLDYLSYIQGRALFNDPSYGGSKNDKSCNSCHPGGKGLMEAGKKERNLTDNIKRCINAALKGDAEEINDEYIRLVRLYIWALQDGIEKE